MDQKPLDRDLGNAPYMTQMQVDEFLDYLDVQISKKRLQMKRKGVPNQFEHDPEVKQLDAIRDKFISIVYGL